MEFQFRLNPIFLQEQPETERSGKRRRKVTLPRIPVPRHLFKLAVLAGESFCTATTPPVCIVQSTMGSRPAYDGRFKKMEVGDLIPGQILIFCLLILIFTMLCVC